MNRCIARFFAVLAQNNSGEMMYDFDRIAPSFQVAELRSETTRVRALLGVFGTLLLLVLVRGIFSLVQGRVGDAWPFVTLLVLITGYEFWWLRYVFQAIDTAQTVPRGMRTANVFIECLPPTAAIWLQVHTPLVGPQRALTSPAILAYFVFIILSTLHLDPGLSRLSGGFSAAGYATAALYVFLRFPGAAGREQLLTYATTFSCVVLLLLGGFAAGAVAAQIRLHVMSALQEAEGRARIEHDLGVARTIQQGLLPKAPADIEGWDIAGWNLPADETGGDYFDWQPLPDGQLAITVADVTGHGIGPALCMASCRAYARATFAEAPGLRDFLDNLNQLLYQDLPAERFVTMAAGLLDPDNDALELISAGHGPLLFYLAAEDRFRSYDAQGLPLGLIPHFRYGCPQTLTFTPGDILVLVTDGFTEWANASDEEFGAARLKAIIRANRHQSSSTIISELHAAVRKFAGAVPQADDLTVVVVKRERE